MKQSRKNRKESKTRNENSPLLGGGIDKLIGFKSFSCSRQKFRCLQRILSTGVSNYRFPLDPGIPPGRVNNSDKNTFLSLFLFFAGARG